ncbi:MAG: chlorophyll synthesis pathway protein BchC, partial [Pseudomonadota bacterium]
MRTRAITFNAPRELALTSLALTAPADGDVAVDVAFAGVSAGTERLLWSGEMPFFPGLSYPLVPGYEAVGRVASKGDLQGRPVFVPGANCYEGARGLFGATAERVVVPRSRLVPVPESLCGTAAGADALPVDAVLLALAATAQHAIAPLVADSSAAGLTSETAVLVIGHGALGQLV